MEIHRKTAQPGSIERSTMTFTWVVGGRRNRKSHNPPPRFPKPLGMVSIAYVAVATIVDGLKKETTTLVTIW